MYSNYPGAAEDDPKGPPAKAAAPAAKKAADPDSLFLNECRLRRVPLVFHLRGGQCISGTVRAFARYCLDVQTASGSRTILFKHAVDRIETAPTVPAPGTLRPAIGK